MESCLEQGFYSEMGEEAENKIKEVVKKIFLIGQLKNFDKFRGKVFV